MPDQPQPTPAHQWRRLAEDLEAALNAEISCLALNVSHECGAAATLNEVAAHLRDGIALSEQAEREIAAMLLVNEENERLKQALLLAIPWIGEHRDGPTWATPEAKKRNRAMCDEAMESATAFFRGESNESLAERVKRGTP